MNIFKEYHTYIIKAAQDLFPNFDLSPLVESIVVEAPKIESHGDLSTNAAMVLASKVAQKPQEIAKKFLEVLTSHDDIAEVSIAGPGFINFKLKQTRWQRCVKEIISLQDQYGSNNIGKGSYVNVEYVSCNPTGPMHIGHARGAVFGDVLANVLMRCGFKVVKEFYINDAGSQVIDLAKTVFLRYKQAVTKEEITIPEGLYPGDYLIPVGEKLAVEYSSSLSENNLEEIKKFAVDEMMELIKSDLNDLGIKHEVFFSEKTLHNQNKIDHIISKLQSEGFVYKGVLPSPKGKTHENWDAKEQLLFKTTDFGDDQDRPLQKSDGSWTYFAAEVAYFENKIERKFNKLVLILGADHGGYIKRSEAVVKAIDSKVECVIKTCQLVNYVQNGIPIKMSKRSGDFSTVKDIIDLVGKDVIRFMMLTRRNDAVIDFDIAKVVEYSKENPVFYVQYAHVRIVSILNNAKENLSSAYAILTSNETDLTLLSLDEEISLIKNLASWPKVLESSAIFFEPHRIAFYLQSIASDFHALWNLNKDGVGYRFVVADSDNLTASRLSMAMALKIIIAQGLNLMGVKPMEKM
jgi:arginyl-tRNA synthetase